MKNKKIILFISSAILYVAFMGQLIFVYYVDHIYTNELNNEASITTLKKDNLETKEDYVLQYNDDKLTGFKLLENSYSKENYVKHYSFNGEKYDILNKMNSLEKRNIKIKSFEMKFTDDNNIFGQLIMEYKGKGKID